MSPAIICAPWQHGLGRRNSNRKICTPRSNGGAREKLKGAVMAANAGNLKHWHFQIDFEQIAWAVIDVEGQSQNTLGRAQFEELEAIVRAVEEGAAAKAVRGLIIMSGKEKSFIAGADIREFDGLTTEDQVIEVVKAGTGVFDRIERLSVP